MLTARYVQLFGRPCRPSGLCLHSSDHPYGLVDSSTALNSLLDSLNDALDRFVITFYLQLVVTTIKQAYANGALLAEHRVRAIGP